MNTSHESKLKERASVSFSRTVLPLWGLFSLVGLFVYGPSLGGDFISDDLHYVAANEYVHTVSLSNLIDIWNPQSEVTVMVENYAPVHLMLHSAEWQVFGASVVGYHVVNVVLHALAAVLLVLIYQRSGIGFYVAAGGAALFLLHPANVESVAWISQIKSSSALVLSLLALLLHARRPAWALVFFTLALLAKPFAAFALVVVALFSWVRNSSVSGSSSQRPPEPAHWKWLLGWLAIVLAYTWVESSAFADSAAMTPPLYADIGVRLMMIFSVALRYAWMVFSGRGLSTFHEPLPVTGLTDPWFVGGLALLVIFGLWALHALLRRREEGVYLVWAAVSFGPLSGLIPLPYPLADRYVYFILPGLIGALILAGMRFYATLGSSWALGEVGRRRFVWTLGGLAALVLIQASQLTYARSHVFISPESLMSDAEINYPEGVAASTRKASRAAREGRFDDAVFYLKAARVRGYNRVDNLLQDPAYGPMQSHPGFIAVKNEMADDWIDRLAAKSDISHYTARALAQAYIVKENLPQAVAVLEAAVGRPGPIGGTLQADADMVRTEIALRKRLEKARTAAPR